MLEISDLKGSFRVIVAPRRGRGRGSRSQAQKARRQCRPFLAPDFLVILTSGCFFLLGIHRKTFIGERTSVRSTVDLPAIEPGLGWTTQLSNGSIFSRSATLTARSYLPARGRPFC